MSIRNYRNMKQQVKDMIIFRSFIGLRRNIISLLIWINELRKNRYSINSILKNYYIINPNWLLSISNKNININKLYKPEAMHFLIHIESLSKKALKYSNISSANKDTIINTKKDLLKSINLLNPETSIKLWLLNNNTNYNIFKEFSSISKK